MNSFPNQTVSESEKKKEDWLKLHFDYADQVLLDQQKNIDRFQKQIEKYNGNTEENRYRGFVQVKGKQSSKKYIDYHWHLSKIQVVNNEYMKRPLPTYVYSMNRDIIAEKEKKKSQILGAHIQKKGIDFLRNLGIPVFDGVDIPEEPDQLLEAMRLRTNNERSFSKIVKAAIDKKNLRVDFGRSNMHIICGLRAFSRIEILSNGEVVHQVLDPRDEICEFYENDPMRKRTQIHGSRIFMTPGEIVQRYGKFLTKEQIQDIYDSKTNAEEMQDGVHYRINAVNNAIQYAVTHIEWKTKQNRYWKVSENKKDPNNPYRKEISPDDWEKNEKKYRKEEKKKKYKLERERVNNIMEGVRIGWDIYCMTGYKKYCYPNKDFSYCSIGVNNYDGRSISLVDLCDDLNFFINIVHAQIYDTIRKYVGSAFVYDEGMLPEGKDMADVVYSLVEDGIVKINSRATHNQSAYNFDNGHGITFINSPQLADIQQLIALKNDLKRDLDDITMINKERSGDTMASQTATASRQNMSQSRVMTYHINMFTDLHVKNILTKYVEAIRISHAFIKPLEESEFLNELDLSMLQIDKSASYDQLGLGLADIEREIEINERLDGILMPEIIRQGKLDPADLLLVQISETINEKIGIIRDGMERYNKLEDARAQQQSESEQAKIQAAGEQNRALQEESQQNEIEKIVTKAYAEGAKDSLNAKNQVVADRASKIVEDNAAYDAQKQQQQKQQQQR